MTLSIGSAATVTATFSPDAADTIGVVINEINYNSSLQFNAGDWIELYNGGRKPVDIGGWHYTDSDPAHVFTFPAGTTIGPDQYLVLVEDSSLFRSCFPGAQRIYGNTGFGLSGSGESMKLMDGASLTVDSVAYDDVSPWPTEPDGAGATLELVDPASDNTLGTSWKASLAHGTPGMRNSVSTSLDVTAASAAPVSYALAQNYPNPFNPTTRIDYQIAHAGVVSLKVYDVLGREVATLFEGRSVPGRYAAAFNGSDLASGVYVYRLTVNDYVESRKLVLMK